LEDLATVTLVGAFPALTGATALAFTSFLAAGFALDAKTGLLFGLATFKGFLALAAGLLLAAATFLPLAGLAADLDLTAGLAFTRAFLTGFLVTAVLEGFAFPVVAFFDFLLC